MKNFIKSKLLNEYDFLEKPDHPLLKNGPDFLINSHGELIAIFLINSNNNSFLGKLYSKVTLTKLIYTPVLKIIGLIDNISSNYFPEYFECLFDYVDYYQNIDRIIRIASRRKNNKNKINEIFKQQRIFHEQSFKNIEKTIKIVDFYNKNNHNKSGIIDFNNYIKEKKVKKIITKHAKNFNYVNSNNVFELEQECFSWINTQNFSSFSNSLSNRTTSIVLSDVSIDDGIPFYSKKHNFNYLFLNKELFNLLTLDLIQIKEISYLGWVLSDFPIDEEDLQNKFLL